MRLGVAVLAIALAATMVVMGPLCEGTGSYYPSTQALWLQEMTAATGSVDPSIKVHSAQRCTVSNGDVMLLVGGECQMGASSSVCVQLCAFKGKGGVDCTYGPAIDVPAALAAPAANHTLAAMDWVGDNDNPATSHTAVIVAMSWGMNPMNPVATLFNVTVDNATALPSGFAPLCGSPPCGRELDVVLHDGVIHMVANEMVPQLRTFSLSGSPINTIDLSTSTGPFSVSNTGINPKIAFNSGTNVGVVFTTKPESGSSYRLCGWPFMAFAGVVTLPLGHQCSPIISPPAPPAPPGPPMPMMPCMSSAMFDPDIGAHVVGLGFTNGTFHIMQYDTAGPTISFSAVSGLPTFPFAPSPPPPPGSPPGVNFDALFLSRFMYGAGQNKRIFFAHVQGQMYSAMLDAASSVVEATATHESDLGGATYGFSAIGGGPFDWRGGLILADDGSGFVPISLTSVAPPVFPTMDPSSAFVTPNPWLGTDIFSTAALGSPLNFTVYAETAPTLQWRRLLGTVVEVSIATGLDACDVMEMYTTGTHSWDTGSGCLKAPDNSVRGCLSSSPPTWKFEVKHIDVTSDELADMMSTLHLVCIKDGHRYPPETAKVMSVTVKESRDAWSSPSTVQVAAGPTKAFFVPSFSGGGANWAGTSPVTPVTAPSGATTTIPILSSGLAITSPNSIRDAFLNTTVIYKIIAGFKAATDSFVFVPGNYAVTKDDGVPVDMVVRPYAGDDSRFWVGDAVMHFNFAGDEVRVSFGNATDGAYVLAAMEAVAIQFQDDGTGVGGARKVELLYEYTFGVSFGPPRTDTLAQMEFDVVGSACGDGHADFFQAPDGRQHEFCDDGNRANGDGCNDLCEIESGWTCVLNMTEPDPSRRGSVCSAVRKEEQRERDLLDIKTDPVTSSVAWTGYFLAAVLIAVIAMTVYKRAVNTTVLKPNHVQAGIVTKLLREHSLLGIVFVHKSDPFSWFPRIIALVIQLDITYMTSVAILILFQDEEGSITGYALSALVSSLLSVVLGLQLYTSLVRSSSPKVAASARAIGMIIALVLTGVNAMLVLGNALIFPSELINYHKSVLIAFTAGLFSDFAIVEPITIIIKRYLWLEASVYQGATGGTHKASSVVPMDTLGDKTRGGPIDMDVDDLTPTPAVLGAAAAFGAGAGAGAGAALASKKNKANDADASRAGNPAADAGRKAAESKSSMSLLQPPATAAPLRRVRTADQPIRTPSVLADPGPPPGSANIDTFVFRG